MTTPRHVYEFGLGSASGDLVTEDGHRSPLPIDVWSGRPDAADEALLARCDGPTLDVGCGPGRMASALVARGTPSLGIDISSMAVQMTIAQGGLALQRNVFDVVLGEGRWAHVLLADGNVGIGADPRRLLLRCADLLRPGGTVLLDLAPHGTGMVTRRVRLESMGSTSSWFQWTWLGVDALPQLAASVGLFPAGIWRVGSRWQAELAQAAPAPGRLG